MLRRGYFHQLFIESIYVLLLEREAELDMLIATSYPDKTPSTRELVE
jgi:hypothetical protein